MPLIWLLGFIPGLTWLFIFLSRDKHPEPKQMLARVFMWGMLIAPIAIVLEWIGQGALSGVPGASVWYLFLVVAPVEEFLKYAVFHFKVESSRAYDEPIDAMIYMITAALGFATIENILLLIQQSGDSVEIILTRFLSATLLHALAAGIVGYYIGARRPVAIGLFIAILFHGVYNYFALIGNSDGLAGIVVVLVSLSALVSFYLRRLRNQSTN